jgi:hypothetical protein
MNAVTEDIKDILVSEGSLGLTFKTNLFIGREPDKPADCVTLFDTTSNVQLTLDKESSYYYPAIQVRVRNCSYVVAEQLARDIVDALGEHSQETWNDTLYTLIRCASGPAFLAWDENNRAKFIINFNVQRR